MSQYSWLIISAVLLSVELATGTFYLLMLAISGVVAWLIQLSGASFLVQTLVFLVSSGILVTIVHRIRANKLKHTTVNIADQLDAGEIVSVTQWHNGIGHTHYRGSVWQTQLETPNDSPAVGNYRIVRFEGTRLLVAPV